MEYVLVRRQVSKPRFKRLLLLGKILTACQQFRPRCEKRAMGRGHTNEASVNWPMELATGLEAPQGGSVNSWGQRAPPRFFCQHNMLESDRRSRRRKSEVTIMSESSQKTSSYPSSSSVMSTDGLTDHPLWEIPAVSRHARTESRSNGAMSRRMLLGAKSLIGRLGHVSRRLDTISIAPTTWRSRSS